MKKSKIANTLTLVAACVLTLTACVKEATHIADLDVDTINKIQVISAMGNPLYGADSKIITDENEIEDFVRTFNSGIIGNKCPDDELSVGFTSEYVFYNNENIVAEYKYNVNNTKILALEDGFYFVDYGDGLDSPYQLYEKSISTKIVVDLDGKEIKIIGTVCGEEMERIVVNNVTYVPNTVEICNGTDNSVYIGKGARSNGEVVVDLYKLDQDTNLSYLYVRFGQKGQIYQRENLFSK